MALCFGPRGGAVLTVRALPWFDADVFHHVGADTGPAHTGIVTLVASEKELQCLKISHLQFHIIQQGAYQLLKIYLKPF